MSVDRWTFFQTIGATIPIGILLFLLSIGQRRYIQQQIEITRRLIRETKTTLTSKYPTSNLIEIENESSRIENIHPNEHSSSDHNLHHAISAADFVVEKQQESRMQPCLPQVFWQELG